MTATQRALVEALRLIPDGWRIGKLWSSAMRKDGPWWGIELCRGFYADATGYACVVVKAALTMESAIEQASAIARAEQEAAPGHTDLMVSPESLDKFLEENPPPAEQEAKHE